MRSFQTNTKSNNGVRSMTKPDLALEALVTIPPALIRTAPKGRDAVAVELMAWRELRRSRLRLGGCPHVTILTPARLADGSGAIQLHAGSTLSGESELKGNPLNPHSPYRAQIHPPPTPVCG